MHQEHVSWRAGEFLNPHGRAVNGATFDHETPGPIVAGASGPEIAKPWVLPRECVANLGRVPLTCTSGRHEAFDQQVGAGKNEGSTASGRHRSEERKNTHSSQGTGLPSGREVQMPLAVR